MPTMPRSRYVNQLSLRLSCLVLVALACARGTSSSPPSDAGDPALRFCDPNVQECTPTASEKASLAVRSMRRVSPHGSWLSVLLPGQYSRNMLAEDHYQDTSLELIHHLETTMDLGLPPWPQLAGCELWPYERLSERASNTLDATW